jgi:hypothetical protein
MKGSLQLSNQYEIDGYRKKIAEQEKRLADFDAVIRETDAKYRSAEQQSKILEHQLRSYEEGQGQSGSLNYG